MTNKTKKSANSKKWKSVQIEGVLDSTEFEGFAGLEVLENYDADFVKGGSKKSYSSGELDGEIFDVRKRKLDSDDEKEDDGLDFLDDKKTRAKKAKKEKKKESKPEKDPQIKKKQKKEPKSESESFPGKFVLLKPPVDDVEETETNLSKTKAWQEIGVSSEEILRALGEKNFEIPTEIQSQTLPQAIFGRCDILGAAETGSGKTLCFGIPMIQGIQKMKNERDEASNEKPLYSVILTPTRELAQQVYNHLKDIAKYTNIEIATVIGGLAAVKQERVLSNEPEIVVATPGRLWELIEGGNEHLKKITSIKYFTVDETDRMIEKGHFEELQHILKLLNNEESSKALRQNFIFSATLTIVHDLPDYLVSKTNKKKGKAYKLTPGQKINNFISVFGMTNPKIVDITQTSGTAEKLTESRILCELQEKDYNLYYLLMSYPGRTIVFCNTIGCVKRLVSLFKHLNINPLFLHGSMEQKQRLRNLEKFQEDSKAILIATDVAARGLDIPNVSHVIHYQVPTTSENYIHRSGRTARANKEGIAILMMEPNEIKHYVKISKTLSRKEDLPIFPTDTKIMQTVKARVRLAREVEDLDLQNRRHSDELNWRKKASDDIGIDLEEPDDDSDNEGSRNRLAKGVRNALKAKKAQLAKLLNTSIAPSGISLKYPINGENLQHILGASQANPLQIVKDVVEKNKKNKMFKMKLFR